MIGEFKTHNLIDFVFKRFDEFEWGLGDWMSTYTEADTKGLEDADFQRVMNQKDAEREIILQGAKVLDRMREVRREWQRLDYLISRDEDDEDEE